MINEDFPCSLKKGPTLARRVQCFLRYMGYWRVKLKKEKSDPGAPLSSIGLGRTTERLKVVELPPAPTTSEEGNSGIDFFLFHFSCPICDRSGNKADI
jgi:hypothetical protein